MSAVRAAWQQLTAALVADPGLLLACAAATFDPFRADADADVIDEADALTIALQVTRSAFPEIYAQAIERLRAGAPFAEIDRLLCTAISAAGIPLDDLESIGWGIPLYAAGVDLEDPDFYTAHADVRPLLVPFGIDPGQQGRWNLDLPEHAYPAGRAIAASLREQSDLALRQVGWAYAWLFSCTGSSLCDLTDEALSEIPPLSWTADDIAFAIALIAETDGILCDVQAGIRAFHDSPALQAALSRNLAHLIREFRRKGTEDAHSLRLAWPRPDDGADRAALADAELLLVRGDAA